MKKKNNLSYKGTVRVSVQKDNKIISTKTYHNQGTKYLYEFLCYCLVGNFERVKNKKPFKIKLFDNSSQPEAPTPATEVSSEASTFISIDQKGEVLPELDENDNITNYKAVLHFLIPYAFIAKTEIKQICLYSSEATDNDAYSAIYYLTKTVDGNVDWDPIKITNSSASTYNLIIEWELSFNLD